MPVTISVLFYYVSVRSEFRIVIPVTISVLFYYVSVRSEFRVVMHVTISVLFYYVSVRSEFRIVIPVTISANCLQQGSFLINIIRVCLRIVVSNTYCVVFLFCFSSHCVSYVASLSVLPTFLFPLRYSLTIICRQVFKKQVTILIVSLKRIQFVF